MNIETKKVYSENNTFRIYAAGSGLCKTEIKSYASSTQDGDASPPPHFFPPTHIWSVSPNLGYNVCWDHSRSAFPQQVMNHASQVNIVVMPSMFWNAIATISPFLQLTVLGFR